MSRPRPKKPPKPQDSSDESSETGSEINPFSGDETTSSDGIQCSEIEIIATIRVTYPHKKYKHYLNETFSKLSKKGKKKPSKRHKKNNFSKGLSK